MFRLPELQFDRLSFWLGFLAASLFWWLWLRLRPLLPVWAKQFKQYLVLLQQRNFAGLENALRRETLRNAQRQHLASALFPLDDILVEPRMIAPPLPAGFHASPETVSQSIASQVIPYMPDWPEVASPFGVPTLSLAEALENGAHIAVIGQPGSGKTVALADLASRIARRQITEGRLVNAVPVFIHALDLDILVPEGADPIIVLQRVISAQVGVVYQSRVQRYIQSVLRDDQRKIILILDGLDEIPPDSLTALSSYLANLTEKHSHVQVVTAASSDYVDGLLKAGFHPLGIASWSHRQRKAFTQQWGAVWESRVISEAKKQSPYIETPSVLLNYWLGDPSYASPLEWTMRVWSAYAGDAGSNDLLPMLDTHIARYLPGPNLMPALEDLAYSMVSSSRASLSYDDMDKRLSSVKLAKPLPLPTEAAEDQPAKSEPAKKKQARRSITVSQGEQILDSLIQGGVLVLHANNQVRFSSPVFLGYLAGLKLSAAEAEELTHRINWTANILALQYAAACGDDTAWINRLIDDPRLPLARNLLMVSRWLRSAPTNAEWRGFLFRTLVTLIQQEMIPFGVRARMIGAFLLSGDPSVLRLFKQLLSAKSPILRRLALLGCGTMGSPQLINDMLGMLADQDQEVRNTACLALAATPGGAALNAVVQVMLEGDEGIRQAAAEALALIPEDGHKALEEAITYDDLLTRRAAVFGLLQVNAPWARAALEKAAVADGQWVVRNAAAQAIDMLHSTNLAVPKPLPAAPEAAWLITYASRLGIGISPDRPVTEILVRVLKEGTADEQAHAMEYLRLTPDDGIAGGIYSILYGASDPLKEQALTALWWMAISGAELPSPMQFGLG